MTKKNILLAFLLGLTSFWVFNGRVLPKVNQSAGPVQSGWFIQERERWGKEIEKAGAKEAYGSFVEEYQDKDFSRQHMGAHILGELLYKKEGLSGISVCDSSFSFGCYHSLFGAAIGEEGLDVVAEIDEACLDAYGPLGLGCQHGIGHGLGEYLGSKKLVDQLQACAKLSWKAPLLGCASGVFMEYNFPTLVGESKASTQVRSLDQDDPYEPCSSLPKEFRRACYWELASWWEQVFARDYKEIGKLCQNISNVAERQDCFRGLGASIGGTSDFNPSQAKAVCDLMPNQEARVYCRAGASWIFWAMPGQRDKSLLLCDDLSGNLRNTCEQKADLMGELAGVSE